MAIVVYGTRLLQAIAGSLTRVSWRFDINRAASPTLTMVGFQMTPKTYFAQDDFIVKKSMQENPM